MTDFQCCLTERDGIEVKKKLDTITVEKWRMEVKIDGDV